MKRREKIGGKTKERIVSIIKDDFTQKNCVVSPRERQQIDNRWDHFFYIYKIHGANDKQKK